MSLDRVDVDELEDALTKARDWHKSVKNVINEEGDKWLTDLENITDKLVRAERSRLRECHYHAS